MKFSTTENQANSRRAAARLFCLLIIASVAVGYVLANPSRSQYVGFRHKGVYYGERLRNGAKYLGGGLVSNDSYGVTRYTKNSNYMLWLEKILYHDSEGTPVWEVKDVLTFSKRPPNHEFLFSHSSPCRIDGHPDLDLVVMVRSEPRRRSFTPVRAWKVDENRERFQQISIEPIACN